MIAFLFAAAVSPPFAVVPGQAVDNSAPFAPPGGWGEFADVSFLASFLLALGLATALGALIGHHPKTSINRLEEVDAAKMCTLYSFVGAIIGTMVVKYGMVIGFVVFGIGGLFRFRSVVGTTHRTGRVILTSLIGLSCGLNLPHVAVVSAAFAYALFYLLDRAVTYQIMVKSLPNESILDASNAYKRALESAGCTLLSEKKSFLKSNFSFVFRMKSDVQPEHLEQHFEKEVPVGLRGALDWDVR